MTAATSKRRGRRRRARRRAQLSASVAERHARSRQLRRGDQGQRVLASGRRVRRRRRASSPRCTPRTLLATPAAQAEAVALVGSDKANEWLFVAKECVESKLQQLFGRWYLSQPRVRPRSMRRSPPGSTPRTRGRSITSSRTRRSSATRRRCARWSPMRCSREVARMDWVHTELGRPLEELTHDYPRAAPRRHQALPRRGRPRAVSGSADVGRLHRSLARSATPRSRSSARLV